METDRSYYQYVPLSVAVLAKSGISVVSDISEMDFLQTAIPEFRTFIVRPVRYIVMIADFIGRLDFVAHIAYRNPHLWWAIALSNDIIDPFDDSQLNVILSVPDVRDVYAFYDANYVNLPQEVVL